VKLLLDMNLAPQWCGVLAREGFEAVHWSTVGDGRATDSAIMAWARDNGRVVVTHDLDFGALLAATQADGPSVVQIRAQDALPDALAQLLVAALHQHETDLDTGALVVVDQAKARVRLLPLHAAH
jgi:predicted nuclease of predicted toxin-antitoxin system